jgi:hypothetical protein
MAAHGEGMKALYLFVYRVVQALRASGACFGRRTFSWRFIGVSLG